MNDQWIDFAMKPGIRHQRWIQEQRCLWMEKSFLYMKIMVHGHCRAAGAMWASR